MIYLNKVPYFGNFLLFLDWVRSVLVGLYNWRSSVKIFKSVLVLSVLLTMLVACGDDSSSSVSPEPAGDSSSSVNQSSSSITDKGKSSGGSSKSSSSVKPGDDSQKSSSSKKNNSSSSSGDGDSSSSSSTETICNDGDLDTLYSGLYIIYRKCENGTWVKDHYDVLTPSSSSDAHYDMTEQFYCDGSSECECASEDFTDPRDNQVYKTINVYTKDADRNTIVAYRVFAENLNYGQQIKKDVVNSDEKVVEKYCYNDDEWYCDNGFGGLYTWSEAMGLPKACDTLFVDSSAACRDSFVPPGGRIEKFGWYVHRQGICPDGWHVMNYVEWLKFSGISVLALKSSIAWLDWVGDNDYGFAALPVGYLKDGEYDLFGKFSFFWEPQEFNNVGAKSHHIAERRHDEGNIRKDYAASVRCVEDYEDTLWE